MRIDSVQCSYKKKKKQIQKNINNRKLLFEDLKMVKRHWSLNILNLFFIEDFQTFKNLDGDYEENK